VRVLYITGASFKEPNAAALRNIGLASAVTRAGHEVVVASPDVEEENQLASWFPGLPNGLELKAVGARRGEGGVLRRISVRALRSHSGLSQFAADWKPDVVILYQSFLPLLVSARNLAQRIGARFIVDLTEWYDGASLPYGSFGPHNVLNQVSMHGVVPRLPAVIAVSEGLARHASKFGARTLVVPPLFEPRALDLLASPSESGLERLRIAVTGSGITRGQKDRTGLLAIADAAESMDPDGELIEVRVAGPTRGAVEAALGGAAPRAFRFYGQLPWSRSLELVANSSFTLMLRDGNIRRNRLGFPSKVPESLLLGTPILGNVVGDLEDYLVEGQNAALVQSPNATSLRDAIERVVRGTQRWDRDRIRSRAEMQFSPAVYAQRLDAFLASVGLPE
jgi:glycosyltransferase involved in cell wall biosynthesis